MSESAGKAVFLSYASQDAEAARRICDALRAAGVEVWFDQFELRGGDAWDAKIRKQIKECALFVPIISANTQARAEGYFRREWKLAVERTHDMADHVAFLVPVVIDATKDAEAFVPENFRAVQWTRMAAPEKIGALCACVQALLGGRQNQMEMAPPRPVLRGGNVAASSTSSGQKSIAVLAFANLSHDPENEYFSDGISEELLNVLARVPGLRVTARTSSFHFKGKNLPVPEIAEKLGVSYIVEGSVRKAGSRVRITAQLIDAIEDFHVWSETFDRELKDIFAVQDEIAALIAQNLQVRLLAGPRSARAVNPAAYTLCLEGRRAAVSLSQDGIRQAETLFGRALQIDPSFACPHAELAILGLYRCAVRLNASFRHCSAELEAVARHSREALQRDPSSAEPHFALGYFALMGGDLAGAQREIELACRISPESPHRMLVQSFFLQRLGRPDLAIAEMEKASRQDPLAWFPTELLGLNLTMAGRYAEAVERFERAEELGGPPVAYANHALALAKLGRREEAVAKAHAELEPARRAGWSDGFLALSDGFAARVLAETGAHADAAVIVRRLQEGSEPSRCHAGMPLILLGLPVCKAQ